MKTTLNKIRYNPSGEKPCKPGWEKLIKTLGKTKADDEDLHLRTILDSNGLVDAVWCLRAVEDHDREIRLFAVWCARRVQHLMTDQRSLNAVDVSERYANEQASAEELKAARAAAGEAAGEAARAAAWEAAGDAAGAARAAARTAARTAAWGATWEAAGAAAGEAAAGARDAAWEAAWEAAWHATRLGERAAQEAELRRMLNCTDNNFDPYPYKQDT
jgi:hypothetical protein